MVSAMLRFFHYSLVGWGFGLDIALLGLLPLTVPSTGIQLLPQVLPFLPKEATLTPSGGLPMLHRLVCFMVLGCGIPRGLAGLYPHHRGVWMAAILSIMLEAFVFVVEYNVHGSALEPKDLAVPVSLVCVTLFMLANAPPTGHGSSPPFVGGMVRHHFLVRLFNNVAAWVPMPAIDPQAMIREARAKEGLSDFGQPPLEPRFGLLCKCLREEARLSPLGHLTVRYDRLPGVLRQRLRLQKLLTDHPEILDRQIKAPVVITGLARSGTTLLHRVLAADPRLRGPRTWEVNAPAPLTDGWKPGAAAADPRVANARSAEKAVKMLFPDFLAVHPVEADSVEEECLLMDYCSWLSPVPESCWRVPTFGEEQERGSNLEAYQFLKVMLQVLDWQCPAQRWVLKTPHHLWFLDNLFTVFPDAKVVQTHRDPVTCTASIASLISNTRSIMSDNVDPKEVGRTWTTKVFEQLSRSTAVRDRMGPEAFLDVRYTDIIKDTKSVVRDVYKFIGMELTEDTELLLWAALANHGQHRHGKHKYTLDDFGIDKAEVERRFESYKQRFLS